MISCAQYDYIEIACTYKYRIKLILSSGSEISGKALDTQYNDDRKECIKVLVESNETLVVLDSVTKMEAYEENPHFKSIVFE